MHVLEEIHVQPNPRVRFQRGRGGDDARQDLAFAGPKDEEFEVDVDVDGSRAVADQALRGGEQGVEGDAEADFVQDFVGVFGVEVVFDRAGRGFGEVCGGEGDYVVELDLIND